MSHWHEWEGRGPLSGPDITLLVIFPAPVFAFLSGLAGVGPAALLGFLRVGAR